MNCKELMVGDLVYIVRGYDKHLTIEKIKGVIEDEDEPYPVTLSTGETVSLNDINPIPLTEDILVKNGFEKRYFDYDFSYDLYEDDNVSFVRLYDHGEGVFFTETSGGDIMIKYVHQLQHLIRLCGIEKEIEL